MTIDDTIKLFNTIAFPSAVAVYVLWRLEMRLMEIKEAITALTVALAIHTSKS